MSTRFGEIADLYDDVRPSLPIELADTALAYAGTPSVAAEIGAGTGKATALFVGRGFPITCIEPDPRMAAMLRRRQPDVAIEMVPFEEWPPPPGGVSLLYAAQCWHWLTPVVRARRAEAALAPGGTLVVIGLWTAYADPALSTAMQPLLGTDRRSVPMAEWAVAELREATTLTDIRAHRGERTEPCTGDRFIALHQTAGWFRGLTVQEQESTLTRLREITREYAGRLDLVLHTTLILARRNDPGRPGEAPSQIRTPMGSTG